MERPDVWKIPCLALLVASVTAFTVACSDDDETSGPEVDRAYIRTWCESLLAFRNDILAPGRQNIPYATRNIEANQRFLDTMADAKPPDDTRDWHERWIAAGRANLTKLKANDPSAAPDPMDVGPAEPLPERLVALFAELPECAAVSQPAPQPAPPGAQPGNNSHTNASAVQIAPGEVRVSFDYTYATDPQGSTITAITVSPLGPDGRTLDGYTPLATPIGRGSGHSDVVLKFSPAQLTLVTGFTICFTGPDKPDLGCVRIDYRR